MYCIRMYYLLIFTECVIRSVARFCLLSFHGSPTGRYRCRQGKNWKKELPRKHKQILTNCPYDAWCIYQPLHSLPYHSSPGLASIINMDYSYLPDIHKALPYKYRHRVCRKIVRAASMTPNTVAVAGLLTATPPLDSSGLWFL